jgi:hypothetical protein
MPVRPSPVNRPYIPLSAPIAMASVTAAAVAKTHEFLRACKLQGVKPTKRQAARYNAKRGRWAKHVY